MNDAEVDGLIEEARKMSEEWYSITDPALREKAERWRETVKKILRYAQQCKGK
jgi:hypothetical protein